MLNFVLFFYDNLHSYRLCVFVASQVLLQVLLGLYRANREISDKRFAYKFYSPIGDYFVGQGCKSYSYQLQHIPRGTAKNKYE